MLVFCLTFEKGEKRSKTETASLKLNWKWKKGGVTMSQGKLKDEQTNKIKRKLNSCYWMLIKSIRAYTVFCCVSSKKQKRIQWKKRWNCFEGQNDAIDEKNVFDQIFFLKCHSWIDLVLQTFQFIRKKLSFFLFERKS